MSGRVSMSCTNSNSSNGNGKSNGNDNEVVLFREGSRVEVSSSEAGLRGVWFVGTIVKTEPKNYSKNSQNDNLKKKKKKYKELVVVVEYDNLLVDEQSKERLKERVSLPCIRPLPPNPIPLDIIIPSSSNSNSTSNCNAFSFGKDDLVDAFHRDGWWVGIITRVIDEVEHSTYEVFFMDPPEYLIFNRSLLRFHLDWVHGKWIRPQPQSLLTLEKQKVGALDTEKVKLIRLKKCAKKSLVGRSGGASSAGGKKSNEKSNAMVEGSDTDMLVKDTRDSQDKENNGPKGVEGNQKRKRGRPSLKRPIVSVKRAVVSVVKDSIDASTGEASETNSKTKDAQVDGEMLTDVCGDLAPLPGQEGISSQTIMNDLRVSAGSGTTNQCADEASDRQNENAAATLSTPTNAIVVANEGGATDEFADKNRQSWPFVKCSPLWPTIESSPIFQKTARTLHFSSLGKHNEEFREGLAIGYLVTFATTVEKIPKLQISDPTSLIEKYLGTLAELEKHGIDVEPVRVCLNKLLLTKARESQLQDESKEVDRKIAEYDVEKMQLEDRQCEIEAKLRELQQEHEANALKKELKDQEIATLKSKEELIKKDISTVNLDFQRRVASLCD